MLITFLWYNLGMDKDALQKYFFISLLLAISAIIFFVFLPFLEVIILSTIFAVVLGPVHEKITKMIGGRKGTAAFIVILLFAVVVIAPFTYLSFKVLNESKDIYIQLTNHTDIDYIQKLTNAVEKPIQRIYPSFSLNVGEFAKLGADWITAHLSAILSSVLSIVTGIILIFISLFFFLRDGEKFKKTLISLSPLADKYDELIFKKIKLTINATSSGVILVALVQGILAGVGMWVFGIPNPTLWGSISAVASLVPGLGTALIFIPAVAYTYIAGNIPNAIGLLLWGGLIVGLVDNFLTPYLYSRSVDIHQLIMLFAVLGGLVVFGPIGFIFGPIVLAIFFSLIDIYQDIILEAKSL